MRDTIGALRLRAQLILAGMALASLLPFSGADAQTDYYNLDRGRPLRVEDALPIERHAFEWQTAPLRYRWVNPGDVLSIEPELAWGILPRTQVELGLPIERRRVGTRYHYGLTGLELSALHALNAETTTWPSLAVVAEWVAPLGRFASPTGVAAVGAIATRTTSHGRVHVNVSGVPYRVPDGARAAELPRWSAGVAVDRSFPIQAALIGAEFVVERSLADDITVASLGLGARVQLGPRSAIDAGISRSLNGDRDWSITFGSAFAFALLHRLGGTR